MEREGRDVAGAAAQQMGERAAAAMATDPLPRHLPDSMMASALSPNRDGDVRDLGAAGGGRGGGRRGRGGGGRACGGAPVAIRTAPTGSGCLLARALPAAPCRRGVLDHRLKHVGGHNDRLCRGAGSLPRSGSAKKAPAAAAAGAAERGWVAARGRSYRTPLPHCWPCQRCALDTSFCHFRPSRSSPSGPAHLPPQAARRPGLRAPPWRHPPHPGLRPRCSTLSADSILASTPMEEVPLRPGAWGGTGRDGTH